MHPPTIFILCRHGESIWNTERRIQGQSPDAPGLTDVGRWQAEQLARRINRIDVDALLCSDQLRAIETAQIIGETLNLEPQPDSRWRESNLGRWEGLTAYQVQDRWPEEWAAMRNGRDIPRGGGETFAQTQQRALDALADLAERHPGKTVIVVSHGGAIRAAVAHALGIAFDDLHNQLPPNRNATLSVLRAANGRLEAITVMDASHLDLEA